MAHTVNLAAKGILRPFEVKQIKNNINVEGDGSDDDDDHELLSLIKGLDIEELHAEIRDLEDNGECDKDRDDGFVDVFEEMTVEEKMSWAKAVVPLRSALVKVSHSRQ